MLLSKKIKLSKKEFARVSQAVYQYCGINLKSDKLDLVQSRLIKRVRQYESATFNDYLDRVLGDPSGHEFIHFIDCLSTNLTSFFREKQHFDYIKDVFIPGRVASVSGHEPIRVRGWSAGCSSGEEPYSIAITLAESLSNVRFSNVKILASDISSRMIRAAQAGCYPEQRLMAVAPALKKKYFNARTEPSGRCCLVRPELRKMIAFKQINLMSAWPVKVGLDFIFCRNVMIYFDKPTQQKLIDRFYDALLPGGVLFIGHSESLSGISHRFVYVSPTIYRKI